MDTAGWIHSRWHESCPWKDEDVNGDNEGAGMAEENKELDERLREVETGQATQAATLAGAQATQAATTGGMSSTMAAMQAGTMSTMAAGAAGFIAGIFLGMAIVKSK